MLPRLNGKPVFLAINPANNVPQLPLPPQHIMSPQSRNPNPAGDQVAILVRPQKAAFNSKPVLLNVPRKVALKVKVGTTLSFSASNDHKYIVMDSKLHPPVGSRQTPQPRQQPRLPLPASLSVISNKAGGKVSNQTLANLMSNKRPGLTVTRGPGQGGSPSRPPPAKVPRVAAGVAKPRSILPAGANVLSSGEV